MLDIPSFAPDDPSGALVDRVLAIAHLPPTASVAVIGHHTLPLLLALMRHGCARVRSLRPDAASPDGEVAKEDELSEALQAARLRTGGRGRVIVEGLECACRNGLAAVRHRAACAGLDVVSFDHRAGRLVFRPAGNPRPVR